MSKTTQQSHVPRGVLHVSKRYPGAGYSMVNGVRAPFSMQSEIVNLEGDAQVRIREADGTVTLIPLRLIHAFHDRGRTIAAETDRDISWLRKAKTVPIITEMGLVSEETSDPTKYTSKGERATLFGTPVLEWVPGSVFQERYQSEYVQSGWRLGIYGANKVVLGFAEWDDEVQLRRLIESMKDVDALHAMASLIDPSGMLKVTTRWKKAKRVNVYHSLPGLRPHPFIRALTAAGLGTPEGFNLNADGGSIVSVSVIRFGEKVPVVLGIKAPDVLNDHVGVYSTADWYAKARQVLRREGYFSHDELPLPESERNSLNGADPIIWVNRITGKQWENLVDEVSRETVKADLSENATRF